MHAKRWRFLWIPLALSAVPGGLCSEGEDESVEFSIKAAFLLNFTRYVEWPAGAFESEDAPITIGVIGKDPFGPAIDRTMEHKMVGKRRIVVRRFASIKDLKECHMLFVSDAELRGDLRKALAGKSVLTVADFPDFADKEGMVQFVWEESKIRFRINPDNARAAKLKISSSLLRLARIATSKEGEPKADR